MAHELIRQQMKQYQDRLSNLNPKLSFLHPQREDQKSDVAVPQKIQETTKIVVDGDELIICHDCLKRREMEKTRKMKTKEMEKTQQIEAETEVSAPITIIGKRKKASEELSPKKKKQVQVEEKSEPRASARLKNKNKAKTSKVKKRKKSKASQESKKEEKQPFSRRSYVVGEITEILKIVVKHGWTSVMSASGPHLSASALLIWQDEIRKSKILKNNLARTPHSCFNFLKNHIKSSNSNSKERAFLISFRNCYQDGDKNYKNSKLSEIIFKPDIEGLYEECYAAGSD